MGGKLGGGDLWLERSVQQRMIPDADSGAAVCNRHQLDYHVISMNEGYEGYANGPKYPPFCFSRFKGRILYIYTSRRTN
jgi:hypothetical protein